MAATRGLTPLVLAAALVTGTLMAPVGPSAAETGPAARALARLTADADGPLTMRTAADGTVEFLGVPTSADLGGLEAAAVSRPTAAADAAIERYGAAFGTTRPGTSVTRTRTQQTEVGDVVRYQQAIDGVPVLGGEIVVGLREDGGLSSILARTSDAASVAAASVSEDEAAARARAAFVGTAGPGRGVVVEGGGRWLLDGDVIGTDVSSRAAWRFEVTRGVAERRMILVDDRTGGVLMDVDLVDGLGALNRVVCDAGNTPRDVTAERPACTGPAFARSEGGPATGNTEVDAAYENAKAVSDLYAGLGLDLTDLVGRTVSGGDKALAQTVNDCPTTAPLPATCPGSDDYSGSFWSGSQAYYASGYASADDVVGHELTHGVTQHTSNLFDWGQSGAIAESISDIMGEIVDRRHATLDEDMSGWTIGEDLPGGPIRDLADPPQYEQPDFTGSVNYAREGPSDSGVYPDHDGVHINSGVGNKTFHLISQGGEFHGQSYSGIDADDQTLAKSARLWMLVDQSLASGSDWADLAAVLEQSCQSLVGTAGFTAADCDAVHRATLATRLRITPASNAQWDDAEAGCPAGTVRAVLLDGESGDPATKFEDSYSVAPTWGRDDTIARSGDSWLSRSPDVANVSSLVSAESISLPAGQPAYLFFDAWYVLDYFPNGGTFEYFDALTVEVDDTGDAAGPVDAASMPWVNGPADLIYAASGNPAGGRSAFAGDSRGYLGSRVDLTSYAGRTIKPQFTMNTDNGNNVDFYQAAIDNVLVYTCPPAPVDPPVDPPVVTPTGPPVTTPTDTPSPQLVLQPGKPALKGTARVGKWLTAVAGAWRPAGVLLRYQWLRSGKPIKKATKAKYKLVKADKGKKVSVQLTGTKAGYQTATATSKATGKVKGKPEKRR